MQIQNVAIEPPIILAPMAGVTDLPYRLLCAEQGAGLVCMEMVSAKAITYHNKNTDQLMVSDERERPVSLQIFGCEPDIMARAVQMLESRAASYDLLDINMGCPVPKVVNNGEGSALMKDPAQAARIVSEVVRVSHRPVTVKIRKGFDEAHHNAVEMAKRLEDAGAAAIAVHGRTREQYYSGRADWETIARVKKAVKIPVIGNGDVDSPTAAARMLAETGCDAIMVGRAAQGDPWIFHRIRAYLERGVVEPRPGLDEVCAMALRHASMTVAQKGERTAIREMRKHVAWYFSGFPHAAQLRRRSGEVSTYAELEALVEEVRIS